METRTAFTPEREVLVFQFKEVSDMHPDKYGKIGSRMWRENLGVYFREVQGQRVVKPAVIANWIGKHPWIVEPLEKVAVTKPQPTALVDIDPPQPVVNILRIEDSSSLTAPKHTALSQPGNMAANPVLIAQGYSTESEQFAAAELAPSTSPLLPAPTKNGMTNATYTRRSAASIMAGSAQPGVSFVECGNSGLGNAQPKVDTTRKTSKPIPQRFGHINNGAFLERLDIMDNIAEKLNRANTKLTPESTSRVVALLDAWDSFVDTLEAQAPATNPRSSSGPLYSTPLVNGRSGNNGGQVSHNGGGFNEGSDATLPVCYLTTTRLEQLSQCQETGSEILEQGLDPRAFPTAPVVDVREPKMPPVQNISVANTGSSRSNFGPMRHQRHHYHHHHYRNKNHLTIPGFTGSHPTTDKFLEAYQNEHALGGVCREHWTWVEPSLPSSGQISADGHKGTSLFSSSSNWSQSSNG